ncbi:MAG TPA: GEVED domain-containing protein [Planctomycetota bacterium]|nr:GEVED domain-containing protein [Planctomycetota bacterium]
MKRSGIARLPLRALLLVAFAPLLASRLPAQPPNDDCANAIPLFDGVNAGFTNVGATVTAGLGFFVCSNGPNPDVWFTYTASCTGSVTFSTCPAAGGLSSLDSAISTYSGVCGSLTLLGCNDNACATSPELTVNCVSAGQTLLVRVGGFQGDIGTFDLAVTCNPPPPAPPNDDCAGALLVIDGLNLGLSSPGATPSAGPPFSCAPGGADVWFTYTASCTGVASFSLCPPATSSFNALLSVYTGACGGLAEVGCSDDVCGNAPRVSAPASAGAVLLVRVGGAGACPLTGTFDLLVSCAAPPPNDDCLGATPVVDGLNPGLDNTNATEGTVAAACGLSGSPGYADVWFAYTATCAGVVTADTCDATGAPTLADTILSAYDGCGGTELACNDNAVTVCSPRSSLSFSATGGATYLLRVAGASAASSGTFNLTIACAPDAAALDDYGDAPVGTPVARHTNAGQERLGTGVSTEGGPRTPAWFGDAFDDGLISVSNLFPTSTTAQIVVRAVNPAGTQTDFCRLWVRRTGLSLGWATFGDALPSQSASVGAAPVNFTFGPFALSAAAAPSPAVRVRLSRDAAGVQSPTSTGAFGEVEDFVVPGSGGLNVAALAPSTVSDASDAPPPYPPAGIRNVLNERLGAAVDGEGNTPVGYPQTGTGAWDDDGADDDGILRLDGLSPGASVSVRVLATNPSGSTLDAARAWFDWNGDGDWDDPGEATPEEVGLVPVGATGRVFTLGPLAVPAASVDPVPTRIKLCRTSAGGGLLEGGQLAAGASASFGEIEDYLLHLEQGVGCNTATGLAPAAWADDPPRVGLPFTWRLAGLVPGAPVFFLADSSVLGGIDLVAFGLPVPPATCFLYVLPTNVFALVGVGDPNGNFSLTIPVPPIPIFAGAVVYVQGFQIAPPLSVIATNYLALTVLPN